LRLSGNDVAFVCATDEHGTPIVAAAEKAGKTPQQFVDLYHEKDKSEFAKLGFSFDIFYRTSSPENKELAQHFFTKLSENGHIYEREVSQAYCEKDKRFLPDRFVVGTCPHCKSEGQYSDYCDNCGKALTAGEILNPKCIHCGTKPTTKTSKHYFFRLSGFSQKLRDYLKHNKELQPAVTHYVLNWIDNGLADWDITRDLEWGVPVPGEHNMVFYVWFDAPIGYMSSTAKLLGSRQKLDERWKDSKIVHFIGKDIIYHHYLFWPAMLDGTGEFKLPEAIPVRGYLNLQGRKFSKSKNWFVSLEDYLAAFPPDYLRYYVTSITPHTVEDADFYWKDFSDKVNNELVASIGNYVHRTLTLIKRNANSHIPAVTASQLDADDKAVLERITASKEKISGLIEKYELKAGLDEVLSLSGELNRYLSSREPWKDKDAQRVARTLYVCSRGITALAVLLHPYLPFSCEKLLSMLKLDAKKIKWADADAELLKGGTEIGEFSPLFVKVDEKQIAEQEAKLVK
jgi:methionyl-tRNA synthetase